MPYTGPDDESLPDYVKKMAAKLRGQWVGVFNSTMQRCQAGKLAPGPGEKPGQMNCEGRAFRVANGVVAKKETDPPSVEDALAALAFAERALRGTGDADTEADRKDMGADAQPTCEAPQLPYGGAQSFSELTDYMKAVKIESGVGEMEHAFKALVGNIFRDELLTVRQKSQAVVTVAQELADLLKKPADATMAVGMRETQDGEGKGVLGWLSDRLLSLFGQNKEAESGAFFSWEAPDGSWRWLTTQSNKFQDRDGELFPERAHKEYVTAADALGRYPELWLWHTPGTRLGVAEFLDYSDGFVVSAGRYDAGMEPVARRLAADSSKLSVSHGYLYERASKEADGTINRYFTFEVTVLPRQRASSPWMPLDGLLVKEAKMFRPEKRDFLVKYLGSTEKVDALEGALGRMSKELEDAGVDWKEVNDAIAEANTTAVADPPAPASSADDAGAAATLPAWHRGATPPADPPAEGEKKPDGADDETPARLERVESAIETVVEAVKEIGAAVKEMQRSDDDRLADLRSPRRPAPSDPAKRPSASMDTEIDLETVAGLKEALDAQGDKEEKGSPVAPYVKQLMGQR